MFITNPLNPLDIFLKRKKKDATVFVRCFIFHGAKRSSFHQPIFFQMVCDLLPYRYLQDLADGSSPDLDIYHFPNAPKFPYCFLTFHYCFSTFHYCFLTYSGRDFHRLGVTGVPAMKSKNPCLRTPCCVCCVSPACSSTCSLDNWGKNTPVNA